MIGSVHGAFVVYLGVILVWNLLAVRREGGGVHWEAWIVLPVQLVATTALEGAVDDDGRLIVPDVPFFGMTAGSGEHWTMGRKVGHIGMTVGRDDISY